MQVTKYQVDHHHLFSILINDFTLFFSHQSISRDPFTTCYLPSIQRKYPNGDLRYQSSTLKAFRFKAQRLPCVLALCACLILLVRISYAIKNIRYFVCLSSTAVQLY